MKTFLLLSVLASTFAFGQSKIDLTEKQAFEAFKKSNVRKSVGLKIKDFNYNDIKQYSNADKLSETLILKSVPKKSDLDFISQYYWRGTHSRQKNGTPICDDCGMIIFWSIKDLKEANKSFIPG